MNNCIFKQKGSSLLTVLLILFNIIIFAVFLKYEEYRQNVWNKFINSSKEISLTSKDFIKSKQQVDLESGIIPGKYYAEFNHDGVNIKVSTYFSNNGKSISKEFVFNDDLIAKGQANYEVVGSTLHYTDIKGAVRFFPEAEAISVYKNEITFIDDSISKEGGFSFTIKLVQQ